MLHKRNSLIILAMLLLLITSCKKEYTTIGNNLIEPPHFEGKLYDGASVKIYDKKVDKVFATDMPLNTLGVYKDPVFGTLEADFVSALQLIIADSNSDIQGASTGDFGNNVQLIDAKLIIPYFSHVETDATDNTKRYDLDSVFGFNKFTIKVFENNYLLPAYDPNQNLTTRRSYDSNFDFNPYKLGLIGEENDFIPDYSAYITYKRDTDGTFTLDDNGNKIVKDSLAPRMVIPLDINFFQTKIFDHSGEDIITNADRFMNYFRGIYVDAVAQNNDGRLLLLNSSKGKIVVSYTFDFENDHGTPNDTSDDTVDKTYKELIINMSAPKVNNYINQPSANFQTAVNNSDVVNGDSKIYLKGDAGAEGIISLFDAQQLRDLRSKDWMINQAELIVYVDQDAVNYALSKPAKLLLYDYDNQKFLVDLFAAENTTSSNAYFDGTLQQDDNDNYYYSFKITRHIRNVLKNNKMNVRLGLRVVSEYSLKQALLTGDTFYDPDRYNPAGTILYGNQTTVVDKKPILKIYYTDPK